MKSKVYLVILIFCICPFISYAQEQKMSESEIVIFKQVVKEVSRKIKTLSTDFVQYKHLDFLSKDIESSGKMVFMEPDLLQWQYIKPYSYSIIFKSGKILINDEGKKSTVDVGNSKIFGKINKLIIGSISGDLFDDEEFAISYYKNKNNTITKFIPKDTNLLKYIKHIELTFDKDDATVIQVKLFESSEDFTRIELKNKVLNAKISDSIFNN